MISLLSKSATRPRRAKRLACGACALALFGASLPALHAQPQPVESPMLPSDGSTHVMWQRVFASAADDWINDIVAMRDGSFMAVGYLDRQETKSDWRALAVQLRDSGDIIAAREYGAGGGVDAFWSMREADDGRLAFSGFTSRIGGGGIDGWAMVTEKDGTIVKENAYGSGAGYDRFIGLAPAADGGYVYVGHAQPASMPDVRYMLIVKTDASGIEQWRKTHTGPKSDPALYVEPSADGGFIISGGFDDDLLVLKIDAQGNELWRKTIGTPGVVDNNHGLVVLPDRRIVLVGYTASWGARGNDMLAALLSPQGELLKVETFGGADDDRAILARADEQGRVWVIGYTKSAGAGGWDIIITRLDNDGSFEGGVTTLGTDKDDNGAAIRPLPDGIVAHRRLQPQLRPRRRGCIHRAHICAAVEDAASGFRAQDGFPRSTITRWPDCADQHAPPLQSLPSRSACDSIDARDQIHKFTIVNRRYPATRGSEVASQ